MHAPKQLVWRFQIRLSQVVKILVISPLVLGVGLSGGVLSAAEPESIGSIVETKGGALIRSERKGGQPVRIAKKGDPVFVGDTVNTSSSASVKVLMNDKTIIDIGASALFHVKKVEGGGPGRKIEIGLPYGTARAAVAKPLGPGGEFKVRSSAATMGVRGTEFVISSTIDSPAQINRSVTPASSSAGQAPRTTVTVLQGLVAVEQNPVAPAARDARSGGNGPASTPVARAAAPVLVAAGSQAEAVLAPPAAPETNAGAGGGATALASAPAAPRVVQLDSQALRTVAASVSIPTSTLGDFISLETTQAPGSSSGAGGSTGSAYASAGGGGASGSGERSPAAMDAASPSGSSSAGAGGVGMNATAALILDTFVAPPPSLAAVVAPQNVAQVSAGATFTGGVSASTVAAAAQNIAPITAGGIGTTRRLTVVIQAP